MRSFQTVAGQRHADDLFVPSAQATVGQAELFYRRRAQVSDQRMRASHQFLQLRAADIARQVDYDALLVAVEAGEVSVVGADEVRTDCARDVALGRLNLDDLGTHVSQ